MRLRFREVFTGLVLLGLVRAQTGQIKGRVSIPHKFQDATSAAGAGLAAARVILDGGVLSTLPASDGHFALNGVSAGPHLLQVVHPLLSFDPVRIEAVENSGAVKIQGAYMADFEHGKGAKLKYPLGLAPSGTFNYLEQREEFNVLSVFKSPMAIIGLVSMGAMFFLPKLQSMVEEEKIRDLTKACLSGAPSNVSLKMWIDRRIGGEIATWRKDGRAREVSIGLRTDHGEEADAANSIEEAAAEASSTKKRKVEEGGDGQFGSGKGKGR